MHPFVSSRLVLSLLTAVCLVLLGACDSGGSNESDDPNIPSGPSPVRVTNALEGNLTLEVESDTDEFSIEWDADVFRGNSSSGLGDDGSTSDGTFSTDLPNVDEIGSSDEFDKYEVIVTTESDIDLTVRLLNDGNGVAEATAPDDFGDWEIEVQSP